MGLLCDRMALFAWGYSKNKDYSAKSVDFAFAKSQEAANSSGILNIPSGMGLFRDRMRWFCHRKSIFHQEWSVSVTEWTVSVMEGGFSVTEWSDSVTEKAYSIKNGALPWQNVLIPSENGVVPWQNAGFATGLVLRNMLNRQTLQVRFAFGLIYKFLVNLAKLPSFRLAKTCKICTRPPF